MKKSKIVWTDSKSLKRFFEGLNNDNIATDGNVLFSTTKWMDTDFKVKITLEKLK